MFLSLTGCRVSVLYSFTYENISDNTLSYIPYKTKGKVTKTLHVPLNGKAQTLLAKYPWDGNSPFSRFHPSSSTARASSLC
jgi:integrase